MKNTSELPKELFEDVVNKYIHGEIYILEPQEMKKEGDTLIVAYRIKSPEKYAL